MSGRPFTIYKFRTMFVRAQADSSITTWRDARITPVGSVLRRTKLDELPQLVNVLLGDMSLVGPRPEVPDMVRLWDQESRAIILSVRPGITDPASLLFLHEDELLGNGPNATKIYVERVMPEKLRIYRAYVAARSPSGDVRIVLATIGTLLCPGRADT
jgi:lipopolysaccharide/colanic/teichoic acid biosynthesis glycosyltransferase